MSWFLQSLFVSLNFLCLQRNVPFLNLFGTMAYCLILKIGPLIQTKICALIFIIFYVPPCDECFIIIIIINDPKKMC